MLAYVLAFAIGAGSILFYVTAFFFPEIHRKNDFIWSGVGFFYALVLWVFARRITGGLLLGHVASVALLAWLGWQTLSLRRQLTPKAQQTPVPSSEAVQAGIQEQVTKVSLPQRLGQIATSLGGIFSGFKGKEKQTDAAPAPESTTLDKAAIDAIADAESSTTTEVSPDSATTTETPEEDVETIPTEQPQEAAETTETETQATPPNPPSAELEAAAQPETEQPETQTPPVAEIAPDAELAPDAEPATEQKPPSTPGEG